MSTSAVPLEVLSKTTFAPYGVVIDAPSIEKDISGSAFPAGIPANQGSAVKFPDISPLECNFLGSASTRAAITLFHCSPRSVSFLPNQHRAIDVAILERHPYTTQTFIPLGLDPDDSSTSFIVVVAPSIADKPDLRYIRAFKARGDQAVTYSIGTWHSPMIVLGKKAVSFVVTQFMNGVPEDDCEEIEAPNVKIDIEV